MVGVATTIVGVAASVGGSVGASVGAEVGADVGSSVAAGVSVFTGLADEESSLGDLYEANDAAWVRVEAKF